MKYALTAAILIASVSVRAQSLPFNIARDSAIYWFRQYRIDAKNNKIPANTVVADVDKYMKYRNQLLARFNSDEADKNQFIVSLLKDAQDSTKKLTYGKP